MSKYIYHITTDRQRPVCTDTVDYQKIWHMFKTHRCSEGDAKTALAISGVE